MAAAEGAARGLAGRRGRRHGRKLEERGEGGQGLSLRVGGALVAGIALALLLAGHAGAGWRVEAERLWEEGRDQREGGLQESGGEGGGTFSSEESLGGRHLLYKRGRGRGKSYPKLGPWPGVDLSYVGSHMRRHYRFLDLKAKRCGLIRDLRGLLWNDHANYDNLTRWKSPAIPGSMFDHTISFRYRRTKKWNRLLRRHTSKYQCTVLLRGVDYEKLRDCPLVKQRPFDGEVVAPRVEPDEQLTLIAVVFPQYHAFEKNNQFWGTNFTEWSNLKLAFFNPWTLQTIKHPISSHGGYYNFLDHDQRQLTGRLAKHYGIGGLAYHHYWYNCDTRFMEEPLLRILEDGEPDLPFSFIWANHAWTRVWDGFNGEVLQDQKYGEEHCWRRHFEWLLPFFESPKYIKVNGKPLFVFYVLHEIPPGVFEAMVALWRELAVEKGLPGLHIVQSLNLWDTEVSPVVDAVMEYQPNMRRAYVKHQTEARAEKRMHPTHYRGEYLGWDNFPRHNSELGYVNGGFDDDPIHVEARLRHRMRVARRDPNKETPNLFFLTAWNEWGEGNNLEPDNVFGYGNLNAVASAYTRSKAPYETLSDKQVLERLIGSMESCKLVLDIILYTQTYDIDFRQYGSYSEWEGPKNSTEMRYSMMSKRRQKYAEHWQEVGFFLGREFRLISNSEALENGAPRLKLCKLLMNAILDKVVVRYYFELVDES